MSIRFLTAGESHGKALVGIIEGIPAGLEIRGAYIHAELLRRKLGHGRGARQKMETEEIQLLSGIRHGKTLGSPIALLIENKDWKNWQDIMEAEPHEGEVKRRLEVPRPGHADYVGGLKYGHEDMRNVLERASARETAMRVALAAIARKFLEECGCRLASRVVGIGSVAVSAAEAASVSVSEAASMNERADRSPVRCLDPAAEKAMIELIDAAKKSGDTLGGCFEVIATGVPLGLGSYTQWDRRLEGKLAEALMSLNAIKGVEIGLGFEAARTPGSRAHDEYFPGAKPGLISYRSNRSGGIDGGMTTGLPLVVRAAMKPLATLMSPLQSVRLKDGVAESAHVERSDVCAVPAASVIGEALVALVLADAMLEKFGGDSMPEILSRVTEWSRGTRS